MADAKVALEELLHSLGDSSQFVATGELPPVLPGLDVDDVGTIGTPVSAAEAKRVIAKASQAPYGRGEETIVDTDVRRVWQMEPAAFSLRNEAWDEQIAAVVAAVQKEFGIAQKVKAELYKLLIYEKGSFFAPHRDTEKSAGMFATLVVCLPSRHEGGSLIVRHDAQTKTIDFGGKDSEFKTRYAAFYADCQHEIMPVTSGYRICLVYNLALAGKKQPAAPQNGPAVERAAALLKDLFADANDKREKIAIPFEHCYTEAGLTPAQLKGADRARFDVLSRAAEAVDYQIYLALLTHYQTGDVDYDTYEPRSWGRGRWDYDAYVDDGVDMGEIIEEEITLTHFCDANGRTQDFGELHLQDKEVLNDDDKDDWSMSQEVNEATGNAGATVERWYRQGAMVIWPRDRFFGVLSQEGQVSALPALQKMFKDAKKITAECVRFTEKIIQHWNPHQRKRSSDLQTSESYSAQMLAVLERIGAPYLAQKFITEVLPKDFDGSEGEALVRVGNAVGWPFVAAALRKFLAQQVPTSPRVDLGRVVSLIAAVCALEPPKLTDERRAACRVLADELMLVIERLGAVKAPVWQQRDEKRDAIVAGAFQAFAALDAIDCLDRFLAHVLANEGCYDFRDALIPAVRSLHEWIANLPAAWPALARLLAHCLAALREATAEPVTPFPDWARAANLNCKCDDCRVVNSFLKNPNERVLRFPLRKDRRQHLHQQIDAHNCDLTHATERVGSPQTLVCKKTDASYKRRLTQFELDEKSLAELEAIEANSSTTAVRRASPRKATRK